MKKILKSKIRLKGIKKAVKRLPTKEDPAMGLVGIGSSGKKDLSRQHDKYLVKYTSFIGKQK